MPPLDALVLAHVLALALRGDGLPADEALADEEHLLGAAGGRPDGAHQLEARVQVPRSVLEAFRGCRARAQVHHFCARLAIVTCGVEIPDV